MIYKKEAFFKTMDLGKYMPKHTLIQSIVDNAILIAYPISVQEEKADIGHPTENILALL